LKTSLILPAITPFYNKNTPENQEIFLQHFYRINVYTNRKINGDGALFWTLLARKLLNLRVLLKPLRRKVSLRECKNIQNCCC
jgi:hypothetical protein